MISLRESIKKKIISISMCGKFNMNLISEIFWCFINLFECYFNALLELFGVYGQKMNLKRKWGRSSSLKPSGRFLWPCTFDWFHLPVWKKYCKKPPQLSVSSDTDSQRLFVGVSFCWRRAQKIKIVVKNKHIISVRIFSSITGHGQSWACRSGESGPHMNTAAIFGSLFSDWPSSLYFPIPEGVWAERTKAATCCSLHGRTLLHDCRSQSHKPANLTSSWGQSVAEVRRWRRPLCVGNP